MTSVLQRVVRASVFVAVAVAAAACRSSGGARLTAQASDEWTRTFSLPADGELKITNISGGIEITGSTGDAVEVRAERVAHATTEQSARDFLAHINIIGETAPEGVTILTEPIGGVLIGVRFDVNYHVRVPASARIRTQTRNGPTTITGVSGRVVVSDVNGEVVGKGLSGGIEVRAINGRATIEIEKIGTDLIDVRSVNGGIHLTIPPQASANLSASSVNGRIDLTGLSFEPFGDQTPRRVRGRINAGGTPIELNATNGDIQVRPTGT